MEILFIVFVAYLFADIIRDKKFKDYFDNIEE